MMPETLLYDEFETSFATLTAVVSPHGLCALEFHPYAHVHDRLSAWAKRWYGTDQLRRSDQALQPVWEELKQYLAGKRQQFSMRLDLRGTDFQLQVWDALRQIPYGETCSYGDIASSVGRPKAVRAVGGANHVNPVSIIVPCHRVIGANGTLTGYGGGLNIKKLLLELEKGNQ